MKRSVFARYARYGSFLISVAIFVYAGSGLISLYSREQAVDDLFVSLSERVAFAQALESLKSNTNGDGEIVEGGTSSIADQNTTYPISPENMLVLSSDGVLGLSTGVSTDAEYIPQEQISQDLDLGTTAEGDALVAASGEATTTPLVTATVAPTVTPLATIKSDKNSVITKLKYIYAENTDLGGWIKIPGTVVDYPVMYTPRNTEKYIRLSFDGNVSSAGVPFIGSGCAISPRSDNIVIYGHNMRNGSMFAALLSYKSKSFWQSHKTIEFSTLYESGTYDIVAAFQTNLYDADTLRCYKFINTNNVDDFNRFIRAIKSASMYDTGVNASYGDKLITLSTCSYHTTDGRFVVIARKR